MLLNEAYNKTAVELEEKIDMIIYESLVRNKYSLFDNGGQITKNGYQYGNFWLTIDKDRIFELRSTALPDNKLRLDIFKVTLRKNDTMYHVAKTSKHFITENNERSFYRAVEEFIAKCLKK